MASRLTAGIIKDYAVYWLQMFNKHSNTAIRLFPEFVITKSTKARVGDSVRIKIPRIIPLMQDWNPLTDRPMEDKLPPFDHTNLIVKKGIGSEYGVEDLMDDMLGTRGDLEAFARQAREFVPLEVLKMIGLGAGTTKGVCFDGKALFANDHDYGGVALDNLKLADLNTAGLADALAHFSTIKDEKGEIMGIEPKYLMYSPFLNEKALKTLNATIISNTTNIFEKALIPVENPYLPATAWCVLASKKPNTAVISYVQKDFIQNPQKDEITAMFKREAVYFGAKVEYGLAYLDFRLALYYTTS